VTFVINNQRGIALVITLLVVALLTITVIEFTYSVQVDEHMAHNALSGLQASLLARSGINLGEAFLLHDNDQAVDAFTEEWCPEPGPDGHSCRIDDTNGQVLLPQNMRLRVQIVDEGGKLNLNLVRFRTPQEWTNWRNTRDGDPKTQPHPLVDWKTAFETLLAGRGLEPTIADQVLDYWDMVFQTRFSPTGPGGAARAPGQTPGVTPGLAPTPDAAANLQLQQLEFASLDDAAVIPGLTQSALRKLRPVLTALPVAGAGAQQRVNANTAPAVVLSAIVGDEEVVSNIMSQRSQTPIKQPDLVALVGGLNKPGSTSRNYAGAMLGVTTQFFEVSASGVVNPNPVSGRGGISRSARMLVRRTRRTQVPGTGASPVPWTLTQLDWQKEGGAVLFQSQAEQGVGSDDQRALPGS
jgi:type II secretory pathway component PulK